MALAFGPESKPWNAHIPPRRHAHTTMRASMFPYVSSAVFTEARHDSSNLLSYRQNIQTG